MIPQSTIRIRVGSGEHGMARRQLAYRYAPALCLGLTLAGLATLGERSIAREANAPAHAGESVTTLLNTAQTVIGQAIAYPEQRPAHVTAVIVTMQPGETTGWHQHDVPMFGYILEGEVTVDYGVQGSRTYRQGDAVMEAMDWPHSGRNSGGIPARILAVFMGADGVPNTEKVPSPSETEPLTSVPPASRH